MEFDIVSTDFADVEIEASSKEEAARKAITLYEADELALEYYDSYNIETMLNPDFENWEVDEL